MCWSGRCIVHEESFVRNIAYESIGDKYIWKQQEARRLPLVV
jgi:hypothetical protein